MPSMPALVPVRASAALGRVRRRARVTAELLLLLLLLLLLRAQSTHDCCVRRLCA